jgi:hypothetical protein
MKRLLAMTIALAIVAAGCSNGEVSSSSEETSTTQAPTTTVAPSSTVTGAETGIVPADAIDITHVTADLDGDGTPDDIYGYLASNENRMLAVQMTGGQSAELVLPGPPDTAPMVYSAVLGDNQSAILVEDAVPMLDTYSVELYRVQDDALVPVTIGSGSDATNAEFVVRNEVDHISGLSCDSLEDGPVLRAVDLVKQGASDFALTTTTFRLENGALMQLGVETTTVTSPDRATIDAYGTFSCPA